MLLIALVFLIVFAAVAFAAAIGFSVTGSRERKQLRSQLRDAPVRPAEVRAAPLFRRATATGKMAGLLGRAGIVSRLERMIMEAGLTVTPFEILGRSVLFALVLAFVSRFIQNIIPSAIGTPLLGLTGAILPFWWLRRRRARRMRLFESQFPDALEFMARSMLAGHGFVSGLQQISADAPEPLASIFREVANELRLGSPLDVVLTRLNERAPLLDVRFFTSAVFVQQSSGGDLSEILNRLAYIIRERLRLKGEVRALSAHGRLTGMVLLILPILLAVFVLLTSPSYLVNFALQKEGKFLLLMAAAGQMIGFLIIQRIVNIKV